MDIESYAKQVLEWLGPDGIKFFREVKAKHGTLLAVWMEGGIPHPVHFREGMQVRNFLRTITNHSWTSHEYDERWAQIVEEAIKEQ